MTHSHPESPDANSFTLLSGLEPVATRAVLAASKIKRFSAKQVITTEGLRATELFLVQKGRARYYRLTKEGELVVLTRLVPGDVIGLVAMLRNSSAYMATAEATSDCELLCWDRTIVRSFTSRYPVLGENGLRIALAYLRTYMERHVGLVTETAEERLAKTLLKLSHQSGTVHSEGIEIRTTNAELSALADISRFTASRVLNDWARAGTVTKGRGRILLHSPEALMIV